MKTIALIEKNTCYFDRMEEFAVPLLYKVHEPAERKILKQKLNNYIWSVIESYVTFINIEKEDDFFTVVCENITKCFPDKMPDNFLYHTEPSYTSPKRFIEFIYAQPTWKDCENDNSINNIGCLFSLKHNVINNNCVILANNYD